MILEQVQSGGCTVKKLSGLLGVSKKTICSDIHAIGHIHWQDDILYSGERL
jgi:DeoR/GlpR family transcriptional regulator of sugar metabolism